MGPSEAEIEARLADLRRRREAIDREIADHLLYLELGRRLGWAGSASTPAPSAQAGAAPEAAGALDVVRGGLVGVGSQAGEPTACAAPAGAPVSTRRVADPASRPHGADAWVERPGEGPPDREEPADAGGGGVPPPVAFADDPVAARRYGRALVAAACAAIGAAGRPLHAGEILPHLTDLGFTLPGRDPVAALNTRLWKRAAPGGPLRRLGEATYALAEAERADPDGA